MKKTFLLFSILLLAVNCEARKDKTLPYADSIMVFSPHPDDDVLGCGGIMQRYLAWNSHVSVVFMTSGGAKYREKKMTRNELCHLRETEAKKALSKIGVEDFFFMRYDDGKLSCAEHLVAPIVALLQKKLPDIIFMPHELDGHRDHKATYEIVKQAVRLLKQEGRKVPRVFCYEVWTPLQVITHTESIKNYIDKKLAALQEHASQVSNVNYVSSIEALNRYRGIMRFAGPYAECFREIVL